MTIAAEKVHQSLAEHLQVDGFDLVVDLERSRGSRLVDEVTGTAYLDFYTFFASCPLGLNPPQLVEDEEFSKRLLVAARNKPANSDAYTTYFAEFVETFARVAGDPALPHLFFVEGGALAVENALKVAFDWKSRRNEAAGRSPELGTKVLHLTKAFHGRSGYTMSLTNTDPNKVARYPKFAWPRIDVPAVTFPLEEHLAEVEAAEQHALQQAREAFEANPHDIACFLAEPIQSEGGDNHMRPEFLRAMQDLCHEFDALFILDEVQTGMGLTGTTWAYQQLGLEPDVIAFAKKAQLGGIMAGRRVDDVPDNVFHVPSRINSTWGGGLADMVRSQKLLEIIEETGAVENAAAMGRVLLEQLQDLAKRHPETVSNARGRGLLCAIDLPDAATRSTVLARLFTDEHVLLLPCGERSVRFRPILSVTEAELTEATSALDRVLSAVEQG
ncbi:MAG TPA: L-lysine 6-transaminase [Segeticoccus sp.]|uniref:L-lysine 6-transaminase n=1 Tax=Segeticoccus sp. TaxID=2706531 RepID=UPI002D802C1F|nr:L-lysine 6-transaminase [Segeticoccus sp.]HET8598797.1 L-lysine 6-transaminase [Segeticoccus sp.]